MAAALYTKLSAVPDNYIVNHNLSASELQVHIYTVTLLQYLCKNIDLQEQTLFTSDLTDIWDKRH